MRVMLDSNIFDRLVVDPEAASELAERRDIMVFVSPVQLAELAAIPDSDRRGALLGLARELCKTVGSDIGHGGEAIAGSRIDPNHAADKAVAAAALRCDILVTDDNGLLDSARRQGQRAMNWDSFVRRFLFSGS